MSPTPSESEDPEATLYAAPAARKAFQRSNAHGEAAAHLAESQALQLDELGGINPIVAAANPLLGLVPQLRSAVSHPDLMGLREQLLRQIATFEKEARKTGAPADALTASRYVLCTLVDESISLTPWGGSGQWARSSLLVTLFNETWGGEKFFLLLAKMAEDPAKNLHLLELMYICLALGFEGRYRVLDTGKAQLEEVRERLYTMIRAQRGAAERDLSPHWRGLQVATGRGVRFLPLWVTVSLALLLLVGTFIWLLITLNESSDRAFAAMAAIKIPVVRVPPPPAPVAKAEPMRLKKLLAPEIQKDQVRVDEDETTSLVTIRGDNLFGSGSAEIEPAYVAVIAKVAEALNSVPGAVTVRGHTDNTPIHSARFPSNWNLSQERAQSVARMIARTLKDPGRLKSEGVADASPIAPNDSPANRARNRRVEIVLKVAPQ